MPTPWARTGSTLARYPLLTYRSTADWPGVVVPAPWAGESTQAPTARRLPYRPWLRSAAREPAPFSCRGSRYRAWTHRSRRWGAWPPHRRDTQPAGGQVFDQERQQPALLAYPGAAPAYLRAVRKPTPPSSGPSTSKPRIAAPLLGVESSRPRRNLSGPHADELLAIPRRVRGISGSMKGPAEVGSILERYEGVACQAVSVPPHPAYRENPVVRNRLRKIQVANGITRWSDGSACQTILRLGLRRSPLRVAGLTLQSRFPGPSERPDPWER